MAESLIIAAFDDRNEADLAVDELEQAGFSDEQIGYAIRGDEAVRGGMITDAIGTKDREGAVKGITIGTAVGGMIGAAAALTLPGVGPVLASGILWTALGYAGAGAAIGGIVGALSGLGASEEDAVYFQRLFESGKAIVLVNAGNRRDEARQILCKHGGYQAQLRD